MKTRSIGELLIFVVIALGTVSFLSVASGDDQDHSPDQPELVAATRQVLRRIVIAAEENNQAPQKSQVSGDSLTEHYVRVAASEARELSDELAAKAFLLGLGIACDHTDSVRKLPLLGKFVEQIESEEERIRRLECIGRPTIAMREDLALHFLVSAYLTARVGAAAAEAAGLAKEFTDAERQSGFSFIDLAADKAGIRFGLLVLETKVSLDDLAQQFRLQDFMPDIQGLVEGIAIEQFRREYGSTSDARFQAVVREIDNRLDRLNQ